MPPNPHQDNKVQAMRAYTDVKAADGEEEGDPLAVGFF